MKNIVLTGLSASGKSTLGQAVAAELGMRFVDMDELIVEQTGTAIKEIFAAHGETHFRDLETDMAKQVAAMENMVIATGGGTILRQENVSTLRATGRIIFLDRPLENILKDLEVAGRPLLAEGKKQLYEMSRQRRALYLAAADDVFPNTGSLEEAVKNLLALIRDEKLDGRYVVIGDPIGHTLSPPIHNAVFAAMGLPTDYTARFVARGEVGAFADQARALGIKGFNITAPHKQDILPFLDEIEDEAALSGAVNTVVNRDGKLRGYNTDMQGLLLSIQDLGYEYRGSNLVILGTGGTGGAITLKALREQAAKVTVLGRRPQAAAEIADRLQHICPATELVTGDLSEESTLRAMRDCDILLNCIPLGMTGVGEDTRSLDFLAALPKTALAVDLIYSPPRTAFLLAAEAQGLRVLNGLPMLIYQAIIADEHYTGQTLDHRAMYKIVAESLSLQESNPKQ